MRTNHLAVRIAGSLTVLLLITVAVLLSIPDSESSKTKPTTTEVPSVTGDVGYGKSEQLTLVSTTLSEDKDESNKTYSSVYEIPILIVSSQASKSDPKDENELPTIEYKGASDTIEMEFNRRPDGSPFQLAISEENPGSSGPSLQSSFWQAAVVAALHESDDLSGVRVTFSVPNDVDGPSAGGVASLALLSAINHKELPKDFVFTGSILPDGTIGRVMGMVEKLRAAKQMAASRGFSVDSPRAFRMLIPTGVRFAEDLTTGKLIDLQERAAEFNITLIPVRNLKAAYAKVHGLPGDSRSSTDELVAKLPEKLESLLLRDCLKSLSEGDAIWEKIGEEEQRELLVDPIGKFFVTARGEARQALHAGQICYAFDQAILWGEYLKAREQNKLFFKTYSDLYGITGLFPAMDKETARLLTDAPTPEAVLDLLAGELPPVTSQLFFDIYSFYSLGRLISQMDEQLGLDLAQIAALPADQIPEGQTEEQLKFQTVITSKAMQLLLAHIVQNNLSEYHALCKRQGDTLAAMDVDLNRAQQVERFFYTAFRSIETTFQTEVINTYAEDYGLPVDDVLAHLMLYDSTLNIQNPVYVKIHQLHDELEDEKDSKGLLFKTTFNAHLCASSVAEYSGIVVRWSELGAFINENDDLVYEQTSLVSQLIREARRNSIEKMNQCYEKGIPCVSSIWMFEHAEAARDDPDTDKVDVLLSYWQASLQAQALQMLFKSKK